MFFLRTNPVRIAGSITLAAGLIVAMPTAMAQGTLTQSDTRAAAVNPAEPVTFDIPAQDLSAALIEFGRQSGQELLYSGADTDGIHTNGVFGTLSRPAAMGTLLTGTGLEFRTTANGGMLIADRAALDARLAQMEALRIRGIDALPSVEAASVGNGEAALIFGEGDSRYAGIEEVIVTGQKREERMQDVPIAISAFSMDALDTQKIEGGFDLLKAVPNVTFSKSNFTGYNFQVRGIGTQAISATTDPGVAISFNNSTLIVNRLFEQEYLDIERVEVLRGPQGTLYGRNATAGVVNVISAKPRFGDSFGEIKLEAGNYGAQRARAFVNMPVLGRDDLAMRAAFAMTRRDGYGENLAATDGDIQQFIRDNNRQPIVDDIDNRDLWTGRFSLAWQPTDAVKMTAIYEMFREDDRRMRSTKQLCHYDDGNRLLMAADGSEHYAADMIAGNTAIDRLTMLGQLSQGCLPGSMYDRGDVASASRAGHGAYGTPNGNAIPYIRGGRGSQFVMGATLDLALKPPFPGDPRPANEACRSTLLVSECVEDPLATVGGQSRDMRSVFSMLNPEYRARSELVDFTLEVDVSDHIALTSQTLWMSNDLYSTQDFLRFKTYPMFSDSSGARHRSNRSHLQYIVENGVFVDSQLGASDRLLMQDVSRQDSTQLSQEIRLVSNFDGPLNFSVGANYTRFENTADYFVFINALSAMSYVGGVYSGQLRSPGPGYDDGLWGYTGPLNPGQAVGCGTYYADTWRVDDQLVASCFHIQPGSIDEVVNNPQGHNFFMSRNPYALASAGLFGEMYFNVNEAVKLTAGLRMNWDRKTFTPIPSQTMLSDWRGRVTGGDVFTTPNLNADLALGPWALCHPDSPHKMFTSLRNVPCALAGLAPYGRGYPAQPDIVQEWRVPTGRLGVDWKLDPGAAWIEEAMVYGFYTRGYKAGGANPPVQSAPSGLLLEVAQGVTAPATFKSEYVNAFEVGAKTRLLDGAATLNVSAFYYDYQDYQISKIVDRTAVNENVDASIWGLELETLFAPTQNTLFNAAVGFLKTRIADGERSLDLMDRVQGGYQTYVDPAWASVPCVNEAGTPINANHIACRNGGQDRNGFDHWVVIRPSVTQASSCVAPSVLVFEEIVRLGSTFADDDLAQFCPAGRLLTGASFPQGYSPETSAPNGGAGFLADISGNELPSAPRFTVSLGMQHSLYLANTDWELTGRADWYWQDKSYNRVYNTEYDRLQSWASTNFSVWATNNRMGLTVELYVKNAFDASPITGAFLNSDDTGLATNVFTLDPRLIGLSIRKSF